MDLRIEKTERAIKNAFIELRAKKPLEKITVKELCAEACINKSTFYSHYADIYALSEAIERETVLSIIDSIKDLKDEFFDNTAGVTRALCLAFLSQVSLIRILFSGKEQNHLANQLDRELKKVIFRKNPEYEEEYYPVLLHTGGIPRISEQPGGRHRDLCEDDRGNRKMSAADPVMDQKWARRHCFLYVLDRKEREKKQGSL